MAQSRSGQPRSISPERQMVEKTFGILMPYATRRDQWRGDATDPPDPPLFWRESRHRGEPFMLSLFANIPNGDGTLEIVRTIGRAGSHLWRAVVTEPKTITTQGAVPGDPGYPGFSATRVLIPKVGSPELDTKLIRHIRGGVHMEVGFELDHDLSGQRRAQLVAHVRGVLAQTALQAPVDQQEFLAERHIDPRPYLFNSLTAEVATLHAVSRLLVTPS